MSGAFDNEMGDARPVEPHPASAIRALCNPEAELYLIEELIADSRLIEQAADELRAADFSEQVHARLFTRIIAEHSAGRRVEAITLEPFFRDDDDWNREKLFARLSAAEINASRDRTKIRGYVDHIVELAQRRRLTATFQDGIVAARVLETPLSELVVIADEAISAISDVDAEPQHATAGSFARIAVETFGQPVKGVKSGLIPTLDGLIGIVRPGDQVIVAAGVGMGKTASSSSYSIGVAEQGKGVLFVSQEMSGDQLSRRMLSDVCFLLGHPIPYAQIRDGTVPREDMVHIYRALDWLDDHPLEVADIGGLTVAKLRRRVRKQKRRFAAVGQTLDMVVVDYLQLMEPSRPGMSRYEAASEISRGLKQLARDEGVAMFTLSQLNRSYENRQTRRPEKHDLRDSGQIEADADCIVLLHREEAFVRNEEPIGKHENGPEYADWNQKMDDVRGMIEFICPKLRNGEIGKAVGVFHGKYQAVRGGKHG